MFEIFNKNIKISKVVDRRTVRYSTLTFLPKYKNVLKGAHTKTEARTRRPGQEDRWLFIGRCYRLATKKIEW